MVRRSRGLGSHKHIHSSAMPTAQVFLFDTFEGFHNDEMENGVDVRFKDTSVAAVKNLLGTLKSAVPARAFT